MNIRLRVVESIFIFLILRINKNNNHKQKEYVKELEEKKQLLEDALYEEREKSRIDYNKVEELTEKVKKIKNFEKEISISGYLKKIENEKEQNLSTNNLNDFGFSYLSNFLK